MSKIIIDNNINPDDINNLIKKWKQKFHLLIGIEKINAFEILKMFIGVMANELTIKSVMELITHRILNIENNELYVESLDDINGLLK